MRFVVISCFLLLCLQNVAGNLDFGQEMEKFFIKLKRALPCDFAGQKIEPFVFDRSKVGHRPVEFGSQDYFFKLDFDSLNMTGINTFHVLSSIYNRTSKEYTLKIKPPIIHIMSNYILTQSLNGSIIGGSLVDKGFIDVNVTRRIFTTTVNFKNKRNGQFVINNVTFHDSEEGFDHPYEYGKEVNRLINLLKPIYNRVEKEVFKMVGDLIKVEGNVFLSPYDTIHEVSQALVEIIGSDDVGLFGQKLCDIGRD
ncbi:hypothetical protein ACFFRR_006437 [Megaselia abdita]